MTDVLTWPVGRAGRFDSSLAPRRPALGPVLAYALAASFGGALTGLTLAASGALVRGATGLDERALLFVVSPLVLLAAGLQVAGRVAPLPERKKQVPRKWVRWRSNVLMASAFGLVIGSGAATFLGHAASWVLALLVLAAAPSPVGLACGALYGAVRAAPVALTWIGDRAGRDRPRWEALSGRRGSRLSLALAVMSVAAFLSVTVNV